MWAPILVLHEAARGAESLGGRRVAAAQPLDKAVDIGAVVADVQCERIQRLIEQGKAEGAACWQPRSSSPAS